MENIFEKLSSYNILNNLIPGAAFVWLSEFIGITVISSSSIVETLIVYYFCGMIVSRIGSFVIGKICLATKLIKYASKKDYIEAVKKDKLLEALLEISNLYRTCAGMMLAISACKLYTIVAVQLKFSHELTIWIIIIILLYLFSAAFCKQTKHIKNRIEFVKENNEES